MPALHQVRLELGSEAIALVNRQVVTAHRIRVGAKQILEVTLSWTISSGNPTAVTIDGLGSLDPSLTSAPGVVITAPKTFTLTVANPFGSDTQQVLVDMAIGGTPLVCSGGVATISSAIPYILTGDISCRVNITVASGVWSLDCAGHTIAGNGDFTQPAIQIKDNTSTGTIRNCHVTANGATPTAPFFVADNYNPTGQPGLQIVDCYFGESGPSSGVVIQSSSYTTIQRGSIVGGYTVNNNGVGAKPGHHNLATGITILCNSAPPGGTCTATVFAGGHDNTFNGNTVRTTLPTYLSDDAIVLDGGETDFRADGNFLHSFSDCQIEFSGEGDPILRPKITNNHIYSWDGPPPESGVALSGICGYGDSGHKSSIIGGTFTGNQMNNVNTGFCLSTYRDFHDNSFIGNSIGPDFGTPQTLCHYGATVPDPTPQFKSPQFVGFVEIYNPTIAGGSTANNVFSGNYFNSDGKGGSGLANGNIELGPPVLDRTGLYPAGSQVNTANSTGNHCSNFLEVVNRGPAAQFRAAFSGGTVGAPALCVIAVGGFPQFDIPSTIKYGTPGSTCSDGATNVPITGLPQAIDSSVSGTFPTTLAPAEQQRWDISFVPTGYPFACVH